MSYVRTPINYVKNVAKEYADWYKSSGKDEAKQAGQAWGALLQGRRYDESGKQIKPLRRKVGK